jgi:hypothetical protein
MLAPPQINLRVTLVIAQFLLVIYLLKSFKVFHCSVINVLFIIRRSVSNQL